MTPVWYREIKLKDLLGPEDDPQIVKRTATEFVSRLKRDPFYEENGLGDLSLIVEAFDCLAAEDKPSSEDFNEILADLYDWADAHRVWVA